MKLSKKKLQELKDKKISIEDLNKKYFYTQKFGINIDNVLKLLNENICSFQAVVDKFKRIRNDLSDLRLDFLLSNTKFLEEFVQNNKLNKEDLRYLLNTIDRHYELLSLNENAILLKCIVENELFQELVNTFKSMKDFRNKPCLYRLLGNKELFENNRLNREDSRYLSKRVDNIDELRGLCNNTLLIKHILNEFILDKELVDKLNTMIENNSWCNIRTIHTIFELIEYYNKNNKEISKLNELNRNVCSFDLSVDQQLELIEVLKNNEQAQNRLIQLIENNLQDQYSFEQLKNILMKDNEKKKIKLNF